VGEISIPPWFIAALFTIAKIGTQPKCPSMDEWIKKMLSIHIQWLFIQPLKEGNPAICNLEDIMVSEIGQAQKTNIV
jgi:hypothetical protein